MNKMLKKTLLLIVLLVSTFMKSEGKSVIGTENREVNSTVTMGSRIAPSVGEWINFHRAWSFPSLTSFTNLFSDESDENDGSILQNRIDILERTQNQIILAMEQLSKNISALLEFYKLSGTTPMTLPNPDSNNKKTLTESQTVPSTTREVSDEKNDEDQKPKPDDKSEVTYKPVEIEKPETQKNPTPTSSTDDNEDKNSASGNVDQKIPEPTESKPEVSAAENKNT